MRIWDEGTRRGRTRAGGARSGRRSRPGAGAGLGGRQDQGGLRLQDRGQGAGVHPAARDRRRSQRHRGLGDADIIRPAEAAAGNKMPAIIDPSPYYTTLCRGNEGQCMKDFNGDGINDQWPLFYDNYFVPRGYAYVLAQMNGTGITQNGCPHHGGPTDIAGEKSVVDWLNGRVPGFSSPTRESAPKVADWHNGSSAMIGKSYDGTLSNGVAATGVEGLKTIVPISAISAWYNYSRTGGVRHNTNYPGGA